MGILGRQQPMQYGPILGGQPTYVLGGRPNYATMYPPEIVNAQNPLPSYAHLERDPAPPDLAPTQLVKGMAGAVGDRLMQAHEAMPWGGNNPQAIGYDPQAGTVDPSVMVPFAADVAGMATTGALAAPAMKNATGMGIRAYHGSPHDFDRFSMDKIGTGEGAQAYGRGLYFAENEGIARSYRDTLAGNISVDGRPLHVNNRKVGTTGDPEVDDLLIANNGDIEAALANADAHEAAKLKPFLGRVSADNVGKMYEVDINAAPDDFLDWDRPLSEQPKVLESLGVPPELSRRYAELSSQSDDLLYDSLTGGKLDPSGDKARRIEEEMLRVESKAGVRLGTTGGEYMGGENLFGRPDDPAKAAKLRAAGIKGIRYKDAGSRPNPGFSIESIRGALKKAEAAGDATEAAALRAEIAALENPTSNYVVFSDDIVSILKKYGIAGLTAGGAGAAMLGGSQDASAAPTSYSTGGRF